MKDRLDAFVGYLKYVYLNLFSYKNPAISAIIAQNYNEYWENVVNYYDSSEFKLNPRYSIIASHIENNSSVLDLGMGCGFYLDYLRRVKNINPFGVDISDTAVMAAANRYHIPCRKENIESNDFRVEIEYDYIMILEVLEHLADPASVLEKVIGKFKKNLIISVPNLGFYIHRLRLLFGKSPMDWVHHPDEHLHHWTVSDIKWWFNKIHGARFGYNIDHIYYPVGVNKMKDICPSLFATNILIFLSMR